MGMRWLVLLLCLWSLAACVSPAEPEDRLAAVNPSPQDGIGGTGRQAQDGIGGTGIDVADGIGGTGIIGTVTGFGSIWVSQAHVFIDQARITANGQPASESDFRLGQVVAILSDPADEGYRARSVDMVHEVVGPVDSIQVDRSTLRVLGQTVVWDERTRIADGKEAPLDAARLRAGDWLAVSGLRRSDGRIQASRLDRIPPREEVQLIGELRGQNLSGLPLRLAGGMSLPKPARRVLVAGTLADGVLEVRRIGRDAVSQVLEQASDLLLEGYLFDAAADGDILVGGIELVVPEVIDQALPFDTEPGEWLYIEDMDAEFEHFQDWDEWELIDGMDTDGF